MRVITMFNNNNKNKKTTYQSFDSWINTAKNSLNELIEEAEREIEEEEKKKATNLAKNQLFLENFQITKK